MEDIREHFMRAKEPMTARVLYKVDIPGRFLIDLSINGIMFKDTLCDSGSCINLMYMDIAKKIGIKKLQPSRIQIGLADSSSITPKGMVLNLYVRIGDCDVPTDFHIVELQRKGFSNIILGGSFLGTVGAVMNWPNQGMFFTNINKDAF
ncbi:hypothetical protein V5N11_034295 [Cardamine amara subsp. amara]|uniref:Aspartic peptidase DDI1-type domain-containing protein n=1 Tax=Cardamine amara subsp. amara TaxID=228776 RepID=A0ABD1C243_CARAN